MSPKKKIPKPKKPGKIPKADGILGWEDDPSSGGQPISRSAPNLGARPLPLAINAPQPPPREYNRGTPEFRYWAAAEGLRRAADFWGVLVPPGTTWQPGDPLRIGLDQGEDLNAYYDRKGLSFFHAQIDGTKVFSGESPDILCHEEGHAVLDAMKPELWDAMSAEVAAFHESFGDMSAILSALQLPSFRQAILVETGGKLSRTSRLSRLAEQLGWAIRQSRPDLVDPDCLRNAANSFFYQPPESLPPSAPATMLSSEPHSFSRVFTGGFFEALSYMLEKQSASPSDGDLLQVSQDAGRLLVRAIPASPVVPDFYSQVAAHLIAADAQLLNGKYGDGLKSAFVRRGVLTLESAAITARAVGAGGNGGLSAAGGPARTLPRVAIGGDAYGFPGQRLLLHLAGETKRFAVTSAAFDLGPVATPDSERAGRFFVEYLLRRGRLDLGEHGDPETRVAHSGRRKTHRLLEQPEGLLVQRLFFDCGLR